MKESPLLKALPMSMESYQASSHDGYLVPLTTFGATNQKLPQPTLLYGYGCYGVALEMDYSPELALLLSRGWQIAFAHTR